MIKLKSLLREDNTQQPSLSNFKYDPYVNKYEMSWQFNWDVNNFQHRLIDIVSIGYYIEIQRDDLDEYDNFESWLEGSDIYEDINPIEFYVSLDGYKGQPNKGITGTAMPDPNGAGPGILWYTNDTSNDIILPVIEKLCNQVPFQNFEWIMTSEMGMQDDMSIHCDAMLTKNEIIEKDIRKYFANRENM